MTADDHCTHACQVCGKHYVPTRNKDGSARKTKHRVCGSTCMSRLQRGSKPRKQRGTCSIDGCDAPHKSHGYCVKHLAQWRRLGETLAEATHCAHCCEPFTPTVATSIYCSKRCKVAAWRRANPERMTALRKSEQQRIAERRASRPPSVSRVSSGYCTHCGRAYCRPGRNRMYCSDECWRSRNAARDRARSVSKHVKSILSRACKQCGESFAPEYGSKMRLFCCKKCRQMYGRAQRADVGKNHRKRARHYGVAYQPVDPTKVFERDGWRCQICGKRTPKERRGSTQSNAPELDHRVPMSIGGAHSYANVQCACRQCNIEKSNLRSTGQLPLLPISCLGA